MIGSWHDTVVCLSIYAVHCALRVGVGVESCTVVFLVGHYFLVTSLEIFLNAVGCAVGYNNLHSP